MYGGRESQESFSQGRGLPMTKDVPNTIAAGSLTRADLADAVHNEIGLSRAESAALVENVLDRIGDALVGGDNVKISSFGSFVLRNKGLRIGRNPKTGVEVPIEPRTVLTFRPSQLLREAINDAPAVKA
jgi:integration host factor subunit alpha